MFAAGRPTTYYLSSILQKITNILDEKFYTNSFLWLRFFQKCPQKTWIATTSFSKFQCNTGCFDSGNNLAFPFSLTMDPVWCIPNWTQRKKPTHVSPSLLFIPKSWNNHSEYCTRTMFWRILRATNLLTNYKLHKAILISVHQDYPLITIETFCRFKPMDLLSIHSKLSIFLNHPPHWSPNSLASFILRILRCIFHANQRCSNTLESYHRRDK